MNSGFATAIWVILVGIFSILATAFGVGLVSYLWFVGFSGLLLIVGFARADEVEFG